MKYDNEIDLSGLNCPLPILKTKAILVSMNSGEILKIIVTNSDSVHELRTYAKQTGGTLHDISEDNGTHIILFKKG